MIKNVNDGLLCMLFATALLEGVGIGIEGADDGAIAIKYVGTAATTGVGDVLLLLIVVVEYNCYYYYCVIL